MGAAGVWGSAVQVCEEDVVIPTYRAGEPEKNPMFFFGRVSQGAEGRVYPYPLYDTLTGEKADQRYRMVWLENEYLRIGLLPEIGGRIFEGVDKSNGYHFFYRQHVIKPALIGLIGAWISGGVEWNIPHHHRATTFIPVQHWIEQRDDGSRTVWVGELELRHRMRWAVGYTLRPGRSYLEASLRIVNRMPVVNTMLCFANVAVHATEDYQVIFPPSTQFVTHHHKREFTTWPIATTRYGGADFTAGVDVSWYRNHIAANSMFAWNYDSDFMAGYDHGKRAGLLSVADHHVVPGKKLWTWGNGPRGRMWDKILTDEDGPYIELMVGAYSDNQPDYSWLQPYEAKSFSIYWYPFREIGGVKNANLDGAVELEVLPDRKVRVGFHATAAYAAATARLEARGRAIFEEIVAIDPGRPCARTLSLPEGVTEKDLRASLSAGGRELVAYAPVDRKQEPQPEPVEAPQPPRDISTVEELYLAGLRIEQFHHATLEPEPYWEEALRRDAGDVRVNTAMGIRLLKKARYAAAEKHLRKALDRLTAQYTAPKDGEPMYYLGLALEAQGKIDEAFASFYRATWSAAWRGAAYFELAEIDCRRGDFTAAAEHLERSLESNALNLRAWNLLASIRRHQGRVAEAIEILQTMARRIDPLDVRSMAERWLATGAARDAQPLVATLQAHPAAIEETAAEYLDAGLWEDGLKVLRQWVESAVDREDAAQSQGSSLGRVNRQAPPLPALSPAVRGGEGGRRPGEGEAGRTPPMPYYYMAYFAGKLGRAPEEREYLRIAASRSPDYVFPFQAEAIPVLRGAIERNPDDARAHYYLGNLLFDWQPDEAVALWERSAALDPAFPIAHRNLAIAYSHQAKGNSLDKAIASLERAVALPRPYARHFFELDQLYEAAGTQPEKRLERLERHADVVALRDDAQARAIALKVVLGKHDEAIAMMSGRAFEVWEGDSLSVAEHWTDAHLLRGQRHLQAGRNREALADFDAADRIPDNLPSERRGRGGRSSESAYWIGCAREALGEIDAAKKSWQEAVSAERGGDRAQFYRARALEKLGQGEKAVEVFHRLLESGNERLAEGGSIDFFAAFGEQQSQRARLASAHYAAGLGHQGLRQTDKARLEFEKALEISPDHLGARRAMRSL